MAKAQVNYEDDFTVEDETLLSRLEEKNRSGTTSTDAYDALSFLPVTGEAIAAYELPGILSQSGKMIQSKDFLEAAAGTGLATLGVASVLPGVGPVARYAKKGIEGFIPYLGPKTATAGGPFIQRSPEIDTSTTKIIASEEALGGSEKIAKHIELSSSKKKKQDIFKENKSFVDPLDNKISFEIDTRNANLLESAVKETERGFFGSHFLKRNPNQEYGLYKLDDLLTGMDDLFKQYPDLKDAYVQPFNGVVEHNGKLVQAGGAVDFQDFVIKLGPGTSKKNLTEKLLHETQHLVDFLEGRQPGGSPLMFSGTAKQNMKNYRNLSGEVRARLVQDRFFYNLQDEFPKPDTSSKKVLNTEDEIMEVGGQSFEGAKEITKDLNLGSGSLFAPEEKAGRRLLVLSCSDTKCPDVGDKEAIDRYLGPVFQSLKSMGTPADVDVAIMSAKHGLIRADTPIQNYNDKMSPKKADMFKQDAGQMDRIKNTLDGYDNVIVQGGKDYKDVIRAAAGDAKITEVPGGRGIGDQRKSMKEALAFGKIDTPVYHYSRNVEKGFTKFDDSDAGYDLLSHLGQHVGSTPLAAKERFINQNFTGPVKTFYLQTKNLDEAVKMAKERDPRDAIMIPPSGNLGKDKSGKLIPRKGFGGSIPLKADLTKPFLDPATNKPFTEAGLRKWVESYKPELATVDQSFQTARTLRSGLAVEGYTHIPYVNDVEDAGNVSYIMLTDRPEGSTKVLQSPAAKKDPKKFDDSDFMMEDGGVVSLKDKAVNMTRGPRGIEPFIKFMV